MQEIADYLATPRGERERGTSDIFEYTERENGRDRFYDKDTDTESETYNQTDGE